MRGIHKDGKGIQASRPDALSHIAELLPAHALRLGGSGDDAREICRLEGRAPDEAAIDILLRKQLGGVAGLHRATILDAHGLGGLGSDELGEGCADEGVHFLRLIRGSRLARVAPSKTRAFRLSTKPVRNRNYTTNS